MRYCKDSTHRGIGRRATGFVPAKSTASSEPEKSSKPGEIKQHRALADDMEYLNQRKMDVSTDTTSRWMG